MPAIAATQVSRGKRMRNCLQAGNNTLTLRGDLRSACPWNYSQANPQKPDHMNTALRAGTGGLHSAEN
jgi:hypothetical protein